MIIYLLMVHKIAPPQAPNETTTLYNRSLVSSDNVALEKMYKIIYIYIYTHTYIYIYI